jgi:hypothetical protein
MKEKPLGLRLQAARDRIKKLQSTLQWFPGGQKHFFIIIQSLNKIKIPDTVLYSVQ